MKIESKIQHDLNNNIEVLKDTLDLILENWQKNPELVDQIIPLMKAKFDNLEKLLLNLKK